MDLLPIILFILGVAFLMLGWRWQSPPNEEALTALKGLAYLKREFLRVQDQVHSIEDKVQTAQQIELKEAAVREHELRELVQSEVGRREMECREIERKGKSKIYSLRTKAQKDVISGGGVEPKHNISPKYQEVLELAAMGHPIPEIARNLLLSQDAVMMVLHTYSKGAIR